MRKTDELKKESLSKTETKHLKNSRPIHIANSEKVCSGKNTKGMVNDPLHKVITYGSNQPSQQKPKTVLGLIIPSSLNSRRYTQDEIKEGFQVSGILIGLTEISHWKHASSFKKREA